MVSSTNAWSVAASVRSMTCATTLPLRAIAPMTAVLPAYGFRLRFPRCLFRSLPPEDSARGEREAVAVPVAVLARPALARLVDLEAEPAPGTVHLAPRQRSSLEVRPAGLLV